jgi:hypothetical protein
MPILSPTRSAQPPSHLRRPNDRPQNARPTCLHYFSLVVVDTDFRIRACRQRSSSSLLIGPISQMRAFGNPSKNRSSNSIPCHPSNRPDSAKSLARRRTCSLRRRFNRSGTPGLTNDNTPPLCTSATTTASSTPSAT